MSVLQVEHIDANNVIAVSTLPDNDRHLQKKIYINNTKWSVTLRDRQGRHVPVESTRFLQSKGKQVRVLDTDDRRFVITETTSATYTGLMIEYNRLKNINDRGKLTRYQVAWYNALERTLPNVGMYDLYNTTYVHVRYVYNIDDLIGGEILNAPRSIYLREHDIVMDIDNHGYSTDTVHPCDLAAHGTINSDLLGDRFSDDDTTLVALKLVENDRKGFLADRFINLGGDVIRLEPVEDKYLANGLNVVVRNKHLLDQHSSRILSTDDADNVFPMYKSMEAAEARGDEKEYYKRQTEIRKANHDDMVYRQKIEQEHVKRKLDLYAVHERRRQDAAKVLVDSSAKEHQLRVSRIHESQGKLRERSDMMKTTIGLITGILGLLTLLAKAK